MCHELTLDCLDALSLLGSDIEVPAWIQETAALAGKVEEHALGQQPSTAGAAA